MVGRSNATCEFVLVFGSSPNSVATVQNGGVHSQILGNFTRGFQYTEFIMADGSGKPRYENMKTRRVRIENLQNKTNFTGERVV